MQDFQLTKNLTTDCYEGFYADPISCSVLVKVRGDSKRSGDISRDNEETEWEVEEELLNACNYKGDRPLRSTSFKELLHILENYVKDEVSDAEDESDYLITVSASA